MKDDRRGRERRRGGGREGGRFFPITFLPGGGEAGMGNTHLDF